MLLMDSLSRDRTGKVEELYASCYLVTNTNFCVVFVSTETRTR